MTYANAFMAAAPVDRLTPRAVVAAWRGITRVQLWTTFAFGCALYIYLLATLGLPPLEGIPQLALFLAFVFIGNQMQAFAVLLAVVVADRATHQNPDRRGGYALAAIAGLAIGATVAVATVRILIGLFLEPPEFPPLRFHLYVFLDTLMLSLAAVWVVVDRRRAGRARVRMHNAEIERIQAEKRSVESDLQAMQARVEPQFLFNTLAQVKRLYETDVGLAERMLGDLIAYLRAAMPRMRDTTSTVAQEIDLARAYLDIVKVRLGDRLTVQFAIPENVADARMPPMMLLPLIDHAIAHGLGPAQNSGSIRVGVDVGSGKLRLVIVDSGGGFIPEADGDDIGSIRERLVALYGSDATLDLGRGDAESTNAVMVIPHEATAPLTTTRAARGAIRGNEDREAS